MGFDQVRTVTVLGLVLVGFGSWTGLASAHPPETTDHGLNETIFPLLWSGDSDDNLSRDSETYGDAQAAHQLADGTDVPFTRVPDAVDTWNRAEFEEFPSSGTETSIRPVGTTVTSGRFIKDAHATVVAIQPSTRVHLSARERPLYVGESGVVLGVTDYRIGLPPDDSTGNRQVKWSLQSHAFEGTHIYSGGQRLPKEGTGRTWTLPFEGLDPGPRALTVVSEISVTVEKHVRVERDVCRKVGNRTACYTEVDHEVTTLDESLTVSDDVPVTVYDLELQSSRAVYPDGSAVIAVESQNPWLGIEIGADLLGGVWRFYTARAEEWDRLVRSSSDGSTRIHSPLHPLQVHAFPHAFGPSKTAQHGTLVSTEGPQRSRPSLPKSVHLDVAEPRYNGTETMIVELDQAHPAVGVVGLVSGVSRRLDPASVDPIDVNQSNISLSLRHHSQASITATIELRDAETGEPISTRDRPGSVVVDGRHIQTPADGTVTITLPNASGFLTARYAPGSLSDGATLFVGDASTVRTETVSSGNGGSHSGRVLSIGALSVGLVLAGRVFGWRLWPPWRGV